MTVGIEKRHVKWGLEADIRGGFDAMDHAWLVQCIEHRMGDQRVVRHMQKWRHAGVLEEGPWHAQEAGTPQGGSGSPVAATSYLHAVQETRRRRLPWPLPQQGAWLKSVLLGHYRYSGVPRTGSLLPVFRATIRRYWCQIVRRRSQRHRLPWPRLDVLAEPWLPKPHSLHPYPAQRLRVTPRGKSPVR